MSTTPTPYISISPAGVILEKGTLRFSTTIFKGFTTSLTASLVAPGGAPPSIEVSNWSWLVLDGSKNVELKNTDKQVVEVTGIKPGVVTLQARYGGYTNTVELTVEETDLLIYAPDGYVYRVPHNVWADRTPSGMPLDKGVQVLTMHDLSGSVRSLLVDQVPVANIPEPLSSTTGTSTTVGEPSENITCFLLNLNSILLSPPPPTPATPPQPSGKPKP